MYKLLIADDEALERQALRYFIENSPLDIGEIFECSNGNTAVRTALAEQPDIIILDIKMPGLNGLEVMERILAGGGDCKIIFSTAYNYFDYAVKALQLGAMDFMVKPINKETLLGTINKAIDQLDAEREQDDKSGRLEDLMTAMGKKVLTDLILGNVDEEVLYFLDVFGVGDRVVGNTYFLRMEPSMEKAKRQQALEVLRNDLQQLGYRCLANLRNDVITLVIFLQNAAGEESMHRHVETIAASIFRDLRATYQLRPGTLFEEISQIEESYTAARSIDKEPDAAEFLLQVEKAEAEKELPEEIRAVCDYIDKNYSIRITLDTVADIVGFSKYYISRLFKQYMNTTIVDYLIEVRLKNAKNLLLQGNYSIKQISFMVGYTDPNYFTWVFKKMEGMSPVKYRYAQKNTE